MCIVKGVFAGLGQNSGCVWCMHVNNISLPSLLPLRVVSDEMLWVWEPKESKLSKESSLLCPPPPSTLRWCRSSRSEHQLSPKPLSLTLLPFWQDVSCRAFHVDTNTQTGRQLETFSSTMCVAHYGSPGWRVESVVSNCKHALLYGVWGLMHATI